MTVRAAVCNAFWNTAGGGESYAFALARALARRCDVDLLGPAGVDWDAIAERLQIDLGGLRPRVVDFDERSNVTAASREYGLFVNTSFATDAPSAAANSLLVVHFPYQIDEDLGGLARRALRLAMRSPVRGRQSVAEWADGFHGLEGSGTPFRWTTGDARVDVFAPPGQTVPVEIELGDDRPVATTVDLLLDGDVVASAVVGDDHTSDPQRLRVEVTGRDEVAPVPLRIVSDTFVPRDAFGGNDDRKLGVQVRAIRVGDGVLQGIARRAPFLERAQLLRWLDSYDRILVHSYFTQRWMKTWWGREADVVYPAVDAFEAGAKRPVILSVGRFFAPERGHSKKQLEMAVAFRQLAPSAPGWELHFVGGCQPEDRPYLDAVRAMSVGLPVTVHVDAPRSVVADLYSKASIYWHATGLYEDAGRAPQRQEHFGIAVVEAMSAGAVPVVHGVAGPAEIVRDGVDGFHFHSLDRLLSRTRRLIDDPEQRARMSTAAVESARQRFTFDALSTSLDRIVDELQLPVS